MNLSDAIAARVGHALLVEGQSNEHEQLVAAVADAAGFSFVGNPDVHVRAFAQFTVDEARSLKQIAATKAVGEFGRFFVISCTGLTTEAQNALLKVLEEPGEGMLFVLMVPRADVLLPTMRSRMQLVTFDAAPRAESTAEAFLTLSPAKRLAAVGKLLKDKDAAALSTLLDDLEHSLAEVAHTNPKAARAVHTIISTRRLSGGALSKPLLERVALALPISIRT